MCVQSRNGLHDISCGVTVLAWLSASSAVVARMERIQGLVPPTQETQKLLVVKVCLLRPSFALPTKGSNTCYQLRSSQCMQLSAENMTVGMG